MGNLSWPFPRCLFQRGEGGNQISENLRGQLAGRRVTGLIPYFVAEDSESLE